MFYIHVKFDTIIRQINDFKRNFPYNVQNLSVQKWRNKVKCIPAFFVCVKLDKWPKQMLNVYKMNITM